jgi:glycosyltransferase involved in cell wall biosynthesis
LVIGNLDKIAGWLLQDKIVAVSQELSSKLKKIYPPGKVIEIDNSIDPDAVVDKSNEFVDFCPDESHFNVAFVGRFVPVKRVDLFYQIASKILELDSKGNIHFYMIGDGPLWRQMNDDITAAGRENRIHLTGFVQNVAPYLKHMNLLLFTSDHEGLPMTLLEAIVLNVAVISRSLATIKQVLCDGECGFIVDSDNISDFSSLIIEIRDGNQDISSKLAFAIANLQSKYTIKNNAQRYVGVYESVIKV